MRWLKSPTRTRSVPSNSSWTDPVIERASASPITSAAASMSRNSTASMKSTISSALPKLTCADPRREADTRS